MSTSGTYDFSVNLYEIVRQSMLNIRKLDPDEAPTASEMRDCKFVLNMLVKQWMGKTDFAPGLKVWTRKRGHLFLRSTTGALPIGPAEQGWATSYTRSTTSIAAASGAGAVQIASTGGAALGWTIGIQLDDGALFWATVSSAAGSTVNFTPVLPSGVSSGQYVYIYQTAAQNPLHIESAVLRDDDNSDTPLRLMTVQSYDFLSNKADPTNAGDPSAIYFERGLEGSTIYVDVGACQDVAKHIVLTYLEPVQDFTSTADNPHFPQQWYLALCWGLSEQIAPMFKANWTEKMEQLKNTSLLIARQGDPENSELHFQPGAED